MAFVSRFLAEGHVIRCYNHVNLNFEIAFFLCAPREKHVEIQFFCSTQNLFGKFHHFFVLSHRGRLSLFPRLILLISGESGCGLMGLDAN